MIKGKTSTGFEFTIDSSALNDWEFIELLAELNDGNALKMPAVLKYLLGADGAAALKDHCRDKSSGRVPVEAITNELADIFRQTKIKKS